MNSVCYCRFYSKYSCELNIFSYNDISDQNVNFHENHAVFVKTIRNINVWNIIRENGDRHKDRE